MTFQEYLRAKKIDPEKFEKQEPERFRVFGQEYRVMHPDSFTSRKLFLINKLRRAYHYEEVAKQAEEPAKKAGKPKIPVRRPKTE